MTYWPHLAAEAVDSHGALQNAAELAALLTLLELEMPTTVIEIGTYNGGLTWALSHLPLVNKIVTVDLGLPAGTLATENLLREGITYVQGDSRHGGTRDMVRSYLPPDRADVLVIDGGHDFDTVSRDFLNYVPMVSPRGVVVLHDTQGYPGNPTVEVPQYWAKIRYNYRSVELVSVPGGPAGTGIIWKG